MNSESTAKKAAESEPAARGLASLLTPEEMHRLSLMALMSRYVVEGNLAGAHRSPMRGTSSEFSDHKAYGVGDDPRHIDWRVFGRTEKYYLRRFDDDTNLRVYFIVDRSRSMAYGSGEMTKYRYACRLVAALGYVVVKARDSVGLFLHSDRIDASMEARNTFNHLNNMIETLQSQEPGSTTRIAEALHQVAESIRHRALVVVLSDLLDDEGAIGPALAHFRKRLHDVVVLQILDPMELDLGFKKNCEFEDLETKGRINVDPRRLRHAYAEVFGKFLEHHRETCASMRIDYRIARTDHPLDEFARAYLEERRRLSK
jgi:uncharacterized protein (DUF58 family)